ncbi:MAG: putative porin [Crocinitomicaceae bacterium]
MIKHLLFVVLLSNWMFSFGQYTYHYDTLSLDNRMLGSVDSVDALSGTLPTTFDGGITVLSNQGFSLNRLDNDFGGFRFNPEGNKRTLRFSGLPFIGFSYSFGGQGTQFIRADYVQSFTDSLVLNIDYAGNIGNGFLRNSTFRSNQLNLGLEWKSRWYTMQLEGLYANDTLAHNGGIFPASDSIIGLFGLDFTPIRKANAASKNTYGNVALTNYFHFNSGVPNRFGLVTRHEYDIRYRAYHEISDTLQAIYALTNYDTITTYDRVNLARIQNYAGVFFVRENKYIDFKIGHTYWSNLNLGNDFDTTEIDVMSDLRWDFGSLILRNKLKQNIIGGFGAFSEEASLSYQALKWNVSGELSLKRLPPVPLQRDYYANNYSFQLNEVNLDNRLKVGGRFSYQFKEDTLVVGAMLNSLTIRNAYLFDSVMWNQTGSLNALQLGAFGQFKVGKFNFHPRVIYSIEPNSYLPQIQANVRAYFKSTIFKAKKLLLLIGVDGSYVSSFQPRSYIPSMDAYAWNFTSPSVTEGMANAHVFATIEISTFRFFVRYENIGYFWNKDTLSEYVDYPIAGQRIRLGLAWSFFN